MECYLLLASFPGPRPWPASHCLQYFTILQATGSWARAWDEANLLHSEMVFHLPVGTYAHMTKNTKLSLLFYILQVGGGLEAYSLRSPSTSGLTSLYDFSGGYLDRMSCIDKWSSLISFCLKGNVRLISC